MSGRITLLAAVVLLSSGCGGGGDGGGGDAEPADASAPNAAPAAATTAAPADAANASAPAAAPAPITGPERQEGCEDDSDPADYAPDQIPQVVRPCELPAELVVQQLRDGTGPAAEAGDTMILDYTGIRSEDGFVFDTSYTRGAPLDIQLGRGDVIQGWDEGLVGANAGSLIRLDIPADSAYGENPPASDVIRPGDALTFMIEVRAVVPAVTAADAPLDLDIEPSVGATGLTITDLTVGDGAVVEAGDTTVIHVLLVRGDNEIVLLNTWERMDPLQIIMEDGQTLPGLLEGLQGATVGTRRVMAMPPALAFGVDGEPSLGLPAGIDLIVIADVVGAF